MWGGLKGALQGSLALRPWTSELPQKPPGSWHLAGRPADSAHSGRSSCGGRCLGRSSCPVRGPSRGRSGAQSAPAGMGTYCCAPCTTASHQTVHLRTPGPVLWVLQRGKALAVYLNMLLWNLHELQS